MGALGIRGGNTGHKGLNRDISQVNKGGGASREITIDSAAEESVCPLSWGHREFGVMSFGKLGKLYFRAANGSRIQHFGRRKCLFKGLGSKGVFGMEFQVSEEKKHLAAVWRIAEKGNRVCFGPGEKDNFVENISSGEKMFLRRVGGSYVLNVDSVSEKEGVLGGLA